LVEHGLEAATAHLPELSAEKSACRYIALSIPLLHDRFGAAAVTRSFDRQLTKLSQFARERFSTTLNLPSVSMVDVSELSAFPVASVSGTRPLLKAPAHQSPAVPAAPFAHVERSRKTSQAVAKSRRDIGQPTPLQIYLQDINETPLLSAEEERALADRVAVGDPIAREHMVKANLRLVVNIARGYLGKGLNLEDLIEEGNLGLMRAVEGFDSLMETRFSTYASYWIKQSIRRAVLNTGKPIRLPAYMVSLLSKWRRATAALTDRLGRAPTHDEVGKALRLSKNKMRIVAIAIRAHGLASPSEIPDEDRPAFDRVLTDDRSKDPGSRMIYADDLDPIFVHLDALEDREATVIRMRFGLDSYQPMTLREVGENLGLTREGVRQLESQALQKLMSALSDSSAHPPDQGSPPA
jgi:RNA polymerase primary sigma factor